MKTPKEKRAEQAISDISTYIVNNGLFTMTETQAKGVITATALSVGINFAAKLSAQLHIKLSNATFRTARYAARFVESGNGHESYVGFRADVFDDNLADFLLFATSASFVTNYRCFPLLKSLLERQKGGRALVREALELVASIRQFQLAVAEKTTLEMAA